MQSLSIEQAEGHLTEIVEKLEPGDEVILTRDDKPVATIKATLPVAVHDPIRSFRGP